MILLYLNHETITVKHTLQKYLSVFYLMLFIFQIALTDSITIKNFSINSIHALYGDEIDHDYLIDFESTGDGESGEGDNEEGESDEKNDEEQDLEDDFLRQVISMSSLSASECNHFEYVLKSYTKRVKEQFSPPDCRV